MRRTPCPVTLFANVYPEGVAGRPSLPGRLQGGIGSTGQETEPAVVGDRLVSEEASLAGHAGFRGGHDLNRSWFFGFALFILCGY